MKITIFVIQKKRITKYSIMATNKVKNLKKGDWQDIANHLKIKSEKTSVVRYYVEKIAEKIGVDDKIVKLEDLKQEVHAELTKLGIVSTTTGKIEPVEAKKEKKATANTKKATTKKKTTPKPKKTKAKKPTTKSDSKNASDEKPPEKDVAPKKSKLELLRDEVDSLGASWGENHTEADLEQLVTALKNVGAVPSPPSTTTEEIVTDTKEGELTVASLDELKNNAPNQSGVNMPPIPAPTQRSTPQIAMTQKISQPTTVDKKQLIGYRGAIMKTISSHFRLLSKREINELFTGDSYPFDSYVNNHPSAQNQLEIILVSGKNEVRLPSDDTNEWISISG